MPFVAPIEALFGDDVAMNRLIATARGQAKILYQLGKDYQLPHVPFEKLMPTGMIA